MDDTHSFGDYHLPRCALGCGSRVPAPALACTRCDPFGDIPIIIETFGDMCELRIDQNVELTRSRHRLVHRYHRILGRISCAIRRGHRPVMPAPPPGIRANAPWLRPVCTRCGRRLSRSSTPGRTL